MAETEPQDRMSQSKDQIEALTQQVAALATQKSTNSKNRPALVRCFNCNGLGHLQRNCPSFPIQSQSLRFGCGCFKCGQPGHIQKECPRGRGVWIGSQMPRQLNIDSPSSLVTVATIKIDAVILKAYFGNNQTKMMLDSGSAVSLVRQDIVKSCNIISQMPLPQYNWLQPQTNCRQTAN